MVRDFPGRTRPLFAGLSDTLSCNAVGFVVSVNGVDDDNDDEEVYLEYLEEEVGEEF